MSETEGWEDLDEGWDEVETGGGGYVPLPPGVYQAQIVTSRPEVADWGDRQVRWEWQVLSGPETGRKIGVWDNLDHEVGLSIFKSRLEALGVDPEVPPSKAKVMLEAGQFLDVACEIYVAKPKPKPDTDGEFYPSAVYINKAGGVVARQGAPAEDDDIPF